MMKRIEQIAEGLTILAKYDGHGYGVSPEHDIIYVNIDERPTAADFARLTELSWFEPEELNSGDGTIWAFFT